jgi:hypothetical protein
MSADSIALARYRFVGRHTTHDYRLSPVNHCASSFTRPEISVHVMQREIIQTINIKIVPVLLQLNEHNLETRAI